jgi:uncharacterized membrane protein
MARETNANDIAEPVVQTIVSAHRLEYVLALDVPRLVALARASNAVIHVPVAVGDPVVAGTPLALVHGSGAPLGERELRRCIVVGPDRNAESGPKYSIRLLVDIAIRALSPAVNDPTTAVQALDQLEAILVRLGNSHLDIGNVRDEEGALRLVYPSATWEEYLELAVVEIQQYGAEAVQVARRLAALFDALLSRVPKERRGAVNRLAEEHLSVVRSKFPREHRMRVEQLDREGLGHTASNGERTPGLA